MTLPILQQLFDLARRGKANVPSHADPERFHGEKSEIEIGSIAVAKLIEERRI